MASRTVLSAVSVAAVRRGERGGVKASAGPGERERRSRCRWSSLWLLVGDPFAARACAVGAAGGLMPRRWRADADEAPEDEA